MVRLQFAANAGTAVAVDATNATLPDQCSPLEPRDPSDRVLASGCVINGVGEVGPTVLPATGTYTLVVDPSGGATGTISPTLKG